MSIRRVPVTLTLFDPSRPLLPDPAAMRAASKKLDWLLRCPPDLRGADGPGPHLWEGDQA